MYTLFSGFFRHFCSSSTAIRVEFKYTLSRRKIVIWLGRSTENTSEEYVLYLFRIFWRLFRLKKRNSLLNRKFLHQFAAACLQNTLKWARIIPLRKFSLSVMVGVLFSFLFHLFCNIRKLYVLGFAGKKRHHKSCRNFIWVWGDDMSRKIRESSASKYRIFKTLWSGFAI